jgi:hypothetical protein
MDSTQPQAIVVVHGVLVADEVRNRAAETQPQAIVVVHGVGDHQEGERAKALARAMAQTIEPNVGWSLPSLVTRIGDVQAEDEAGEGILPRGFTFSSYQITVPWPGPGREVDLYEFYWSKLSRKGLGLLGEVQKIWRFLVGPPRIGFQALTMPVAGIGGFVLGLARVVYGLVWLWVILRMIASLSLLFLIGVIKISILRYFDILLIIDSVTAALLILFTVLRWSLLIFDRDSFWISRTAVLALAATVLLTQALPQTIIEVTGFDQKLKDFTPWYRLAKAIPGDDDYPRWQGYKPSWLMSGIWWPPASGTGIWPVKLRPDTGVKPVPPHSRHEPKTFGSSRETFDDSTHIRP